MHRITLAAALLLQVGYSFGQVAQVRDATGALVGPYLGSAGPVPGAVAFNAENPAFTVVSPTGFVASNSVSSGRVAFPIELPGVRFRPDPFVFFASAGCTGQAYFKVFTGTPARVGVPIGGFVFSALGLETAPFFVAKDAVTVVLQPQSRLGIGGACDPVNNQPADSFVPAGPNDPAVTGFPNAPYQPPLRIGVVEPAWRLFSDGFESVSASSAVLAHWTHAQCA